MFYEIWAPPESPQFASWPRPSPEEALGGLGAAFGGSGGGLGDLQEALYTDKNVTTRTYNQLITNL